MMQTTLFDWDLVRKYDRPGPRYTSYPTAVEFQPIQKGRELRRPTGKAEEPLSLYFHLPFCRSLCWYCGCNMKVALKREPMGRYLKQLMREIESFAGSDISKRPVRQIHLGGGTPNYFSVEDLDLLMQTVKRVFSNVAHADCSIEVDPRLLEEDVINRLRDIGFDRISMGIQDFDEQVQKAINRIQPFEMISDQVDAVRRRGYTSLNMDLIYGLPLQSKGRFRTTLERMLKLSPDRIALFNYAHLPSLKPHMKLIKAEDMPSPEQKFSLLTDAVSFFQEAGYVFIGMDHFAKPDDPLAKALADGRLHRNFQGYDTVAGLDMLGFGMSAISMFDHAYVQNLSEIGLYQSAVEAGLSPVHRGVLLDQDDRIRRDLINHLMCRLEIDRDLFQTESGHAFDQYFPDVAPALSEMVEDGLLTETEHGWKVTEGGRLLVRNVAMLFDGRLQRRPETAGRFSRTV